VLQIVGIGYLGDVQLGSFGQAQQDIHIIVDNAAVVLQVYTVQLDVRALQLETQHIVFSNQALVKKALRLFYLRINSNQVLCNYFFACNTL
jgi:hypothetical protein